LKGTLDRAFILFILFIASLTNQLHRCSYVNDSKGRITIFYIDSMLFTSWLKIDYSSLI